ncbi:MAG: MATE family efflux transporter, partial [Firmicutes bacterium]|nr:MATE family efflux transporter [Bacillota bacterium]
MSEIKQQSMNNPLGTEPVGQLLRQFAVPSIVAMMVSALYNIVDQFFIGQSIGELGNAATNVAFP